MCRDVVAIYLFTVDKRNLQYPPSEGSSPLVPSQFVSKKIRIGVRRNYS